jgi:hypothetical protein
MRYARRQARTGCFQAQPLRVLAVLAVSVLLVGPSAAEDTRPQELPYETPGPVPTLDPSYRQTDHEIVLITDNALRPSRIMLNEGQLVAWLSYSKAASTVVFERNVAKSMICHSLVNFSIKDNGLRSAEIHTGEFASFCQLQPGRYRYKVVRRDQKSAGAGGAARRLEGEIIVGKAD